MFKSLVIAGLSATALSTAALAAAQGPRPIFLHGVGLKPNVHTPTSVPTWTFSYTYSGKNYSDIFVGTNPTGGASTTVPVYIIPVKLVVGTTSENPLKKDSTGKTVVDHMIASPIFDATTNYTQGGTNVGTTQYEDAFQRANLWGTVKTNPGYHVLLGTPTVEKLSSFKVPTADAAVVTNPFNNAPGLILNNINWFDAKVQKLLTKFKIPANSLPIITVTSTYWTGGAPTLGNCCIGGYHSVNNAGLPYSVYTYIAGSGSKLAFSQDVSALSHEVGEWLDDPLTNNTNVPSTCAQNGNGIYEVGDPIEVLTNYGDYPYVLNGFTYHIQDLTLPTYFGAPASTSIPFNQSFQGTKFTVCQNGG